jgi:hypothetical protein
MFSLCNALGEGAPEAVKVASICLHFVIASTALPHEPTALRIGFDRFAAVVQRRRLDDA